MLNYRIGLISIFILSGCDAITSSLPEPDCNLNPKPVYSDDQGNMFKGTYKTKTGIFVELDTTKVPDP